MTIIPAIARVARSRRHCALAATLLLAALSFAPCRAHADPGTQIAPDPQAQDAAQPAPAASTGPAAPDSAGAAPVGPGWG